MRHCQEARGRDPRLREVAVRAAPESASAQTVAPGRGVVAGPIADGDSRSVRPVPARAPQPADVSADAGPAPPCRPGGRRATTTASCSREGDRVVGVHLAFYSERMVGGERRRRLQPRRLVRARGATAPTALRLLRALAGPARLPLHRPVPERQRAWRSTRGWGSATSTPRRPWCRTCPLPTPRRPGRHATRRRSRRCSTGDDLRDLPRPPRRRRRPGTSCCADGRRTATSSSAGPPQGAARCSPSLLHVCDPALLREHGARALPPPAARHGAARHARRAAGGRARPRGSRGRSAAPRPKMFRSAGARAARTSTTCTASSTLRGLVRPHEDGRSDEDPISTTWSRAGPAAQPTRPALTLPGHHRRLRRPVGRCQRRGGRPAARSASRRGDRVAIYLDKRHRDRRQRSSVRPPPAASSCRSTPCSSREQVGHVLADCDVRVLVTHAAAAGRSSRTCVGDASRSSTSCSSARADGPEAGRTPCRARVRRPARGPR